MSANMDITEKGLTKDDKLDELEIQHALVKQKEAQAKRWCLFKALVFALLAVLGSEGTLEFVICKEPPESPQRALTVYDCNLDGLDERVKEM
ncbi:hypothetical protein KEM56_006613 [Ascosphaera pollenicola]|nr:hypothetical protein KEM56_006613 [Ascosphaera pollenicola]